MPRIEGAKLRDELKKKRYRIDGGGPFRIYAVETNDPIFAGETSYDFVLAEYDINKMTKEELSGKIMTFPRSWVFNKGRVEPWVADGGSRRRTRAKRRALKKRKITRRR